MPNLAYWLSFDEWSLDTAASLICGDMPNEGLIWRSPEHKAAVEWLRAKVRVIKIKRQAQDLLTGRPHPIIHLLDGVRVADVMKALRAQDPCIWGRDLLKAAGSRPRQSSRPRKLGEAHRRREESMRRYLKQTPRSTWIRFTLLEQWHGALLDFELKFWNIARDTFDRFWKDRAQDLKNAVRLKDKSM